MGEPSLHPSRPALRAAASGGRPRPATPLPCLPHQAVRPYPLLHEEQIAGLHAGGLSPRADGSSPARSFGPALLQGEERPQAAAGHIAEVIHSLLNEPVFGAQCAAMNYSTTRIVKTSKVLIDSHPSIIAPRQDPCCPIRKPEASLYLCPDQCLNSGD